MSKKFGAMVVQYSPGTLDADREGTACVAISHSKPTTPEQRLWLAVIAEALNDAMSGKEPSALIRRRAIWWLTDPRDTPLTFRWAVEHIGLDSDAVQDAVKRKLRQGELKLGIRHVRL